MTNNNPISVTYSDEKLRILVEEYITMQIKGVCSYILYRAMEENCTKGDGLLESDQLQVDDQNRLRIILEAVVKEERIIVSGRDAYSKC